MIDNLQPPAVVRPWRKVAAGVRQVVPHVDGQRSTFQSRDNDLRPERATRGAYANCDGHVVLVPPPERVRELPVHKARRLIVDPVRHRVEVETERGQERLGEPCEAVLAPVRPPRVDDLVAARAAGPRLVVTDNGESVVASQIDVVGARHPVLGVARRQVIEAAGGRRVRPVHRNAHRAHIAGCHNGLDGIEDPWGLARSQVLVGQRPIRNSLAIRIGAGPGLAVSGVVRRGDQARAALIGQEVENLHKRRPLVERRHLVVEERRAQLVRKIVQ